MMQILCQSMSGSLGGRDEGRLVTFNAFIILANKIFRCPYLGTNFYIFAFCPSCCCDDQNSWGRPHQTTLTVQNTQFVDTNFVQIRQKTNFAYSQNSQNHAHKNIARVQNCTDITFWEYLRGLCFGRSWFLKCSSIITHRVNQQ